jgi:hypothetical protein
VGFVVDKVALEQAFSGYFSFPCQSFHQLLLHTHHVSSGAGIIGQIVADPKEVKKTKIYIYIYIKYQFSVLKISIQSGYGK